MTAAGRGVGYPLVLDLTGRQVVVVGGGTVALRRVRGLLAADALVRVVAPVVSAELSALPVEVCRRRYAPGDLADAWLAHACTDSAEVNAAVAAEAGEQRVPRPPTTGSRVCGPTRPPGVPPAHRR